MPGDKSYAAVQAAHLTVVGAEANLRAPYVGHLWISPSFISVRNGWALANAGTEVMHSLSGAGIATNYMAWTDSPTDSTGSGSMFNLGFLYENTLSGIQGKAPGGVPEVTLSVFGLLADASLDLPPLGGMTAADAPQTSIKQFKYGADVTLQASTWLAFMLRYDAVNYDLDHPGYVFLSITPRVIVSSHFLSSERIYLQYSRYIYGDKMMLAGHVALGRAARGGERRPPSRARIRARRPTRTSSSSRPRSPSEHDVGRRSADLGRAVAPLARGVGDRRRPPSDATLDG